MSDFSNNFTIGVQRVGSGYFELYAPFAKQFEADAAVRYYHYNLSGGRASPKIGVKFTPIQQVALRGTASRGFRAPGPGENGSAGQSSLPAPSRTRSCVPMRITRRQRAISRASRAGHSRPAKVNPSLSPEISTQWTAGLVLEPVRDLSATLDFYSIKLLPDRARHHCGVGVGSIVRGTNFFAPLPEYQPDGTTVLTTPPCTDCVLWIELHQRQHDQEQRFDLGLEGEHHSISVR